MNPEPTSSTSNDPASGAAVTPFLTIIQHWWRFLVVVPVLAAILSVVIVLIMPKWYRASASILPPKDQGMLNPLGAASSLLKGLGGSLSKVGAASGPYNYLAILQSRSVMDSIVRRFDLTRVYDESDGSVELAIRELRNNSFFEVQNEDYISIEVLDKDPQRAADMANAFIDILNVVSIQLGTREARNNRVFIEQRLGTISDDLRRAEDALRRYQERSPIVVPPDQGGASFSGIAELYAMKAKKEIEVGILERTVTPDHSQLLQSRLELSEIDKKVEAIPEVGIETLRLMRDVVIQQKILEYVLPLYEQAKVDEQKNVPVLLVLDRAVAPEKKYRPQRLLIVGIITSLAAILGLLAAVWGDRWLHSPHIQDSWKDQVRKVAVRLGAHV